MKTDLDLLNAAIRGNCSAWMETYGKIWAKDRSKGLVTPRLNTLQRRIQKTVDRFDDLGLPVRILGLKPRARGSTTYFTALGYTQMRRSSTSAVFIGGQSDQTVGLWNMMKTYKANDKFPHWGNDGEINEKGATFSNGSRAKKETAKDIQAGIGDTYGLCHATEAARWAQYGVANAAAVMANILKAIPLLAGTSVFLESTAENAGGDFYERWTNATDGEDFLTGRKDINFGSYARVFAAWFEFEESTLTLTSKQKEDIERTLDAEEEYHGERELIEMYSVTSPDGVVRLGDSVVDHDVWEQLAWRRYSIREECGRDPAIFDRDYPSSWNVAFQKSGRMRFNATGMSVLRKRLVGQVAIPGIIEEAKNRRVNFRQTDKNESQVTIFEKPTAGMRYILTVDNMTGASQAAGLDPDYHGVFVMRAGFYDPLGKWRRPCTAGRIIPCRWETDTLEEVVWKLARFYGGPSGCIIAPEANMDRGIIELLKLRGANIYVRQHFNQREQRLTNALGYQTNVKTREALITTLASAIREWDTPGHGVDIWCPHAIEQCENFVLKDTGRSEAGQGYHDDDVIAISLGLELMEHATIYYPPQSIHGIPPELRDTRVVARPGAYS